jgi:hypothetical protein
MFTHYNMNLRSYNFVHMYDSYLLFPNFLYVHDLQMLYFRAT